MEILVALEIGAIGALAVPGAPAMLALLAVLTLEVLDVFDMLNFWTAVEVLVRRGSGPGSITFPARRLTTI